MSPSTFFIFIILALALFVFVVMIAFIISKLFAKTKKQFKKCPDCAEIIKIEAIICRFCSRSI